MTQTGPNLKSSLSTWVDLLARLAWFSVVTAIMVGSSEGRPTFPGDGVTNVEEPSDDVGETSICTQVYETTLEFTFDRKDCGHWFALGARSSGAIEIEGDQEWVHIWASSSESYGSFLGAGSPVESIAIEDEMDKPLQIVRHHWMISRKSSGGEGGAPSVPVETLAGFVSVRVPREPGRDLNSLADAYAWVKHRSGAAWQIPLGDLRLVEQQTRESFEIEDFRIFKDPVQAEDAIALFAIQFSAPIDVGSAVKEGKIKFTDKDGQTLNVALSRSPDDRAWFGAVRSANLTDIVVVISPGLLSKNGLPLVESQVELPSSISIQWEQP
jgi:hypothetical protein